MQNLIHKVFYCYYLFYDEGKALERGCAFASPFYITHSDCIYANPLKDKDVVLVKQALLVVCVN